MAHWIDGRVGGWVVERAAGGSDMGWDGVSGRGEFRDLRGSTAGLEKKQAISG